MFATIFCKKNLEEEEEGKEEESGIQAQFLYSPCVSEYHHTS